jgi:hypothetical protein
MTDELPGVGQIWLARADREPDLYVLVIEGPADWIFTPATWAGEGQSVTTTTPDGPGSSSSSGNSAAYARAPASSDGRCTSSAPRPPKGRPRSL